MQMYLYFFHHLQNVYYSNNKNHLHKMIAEQVMKRFIPNENYQEAKLNFITK